LRYIKIRATFVILKFLENINVHGLRNSGSEIPGCKTGINYILAILRLREAETAVKCWLHNF
jgi:hypothetical protein